MRQSIIYLIDFFGHAAMDTEDSIELRFSSLKDIVSMHEIDKTQTVFVANCPGMKDYNYPIYNRLRERFLEMKRVAELFSWTWIEIKEDLSVDDWCKFVGQLSSLQDINAGNTQIIFGGTNTSGCVFSGKQSSLINFARQGFSTTLFLPLCSDPGGSGRNTIEKNMKSYTVIYNELKHNNLVEHVNIYHRFNDLGLVKA